MKTCHAGFYHFIIAKRQHLQLSGVLPWVNKKLPMTRLSESHQSALWVSGRRKIVLNIRLTLQLIHELSNPYTRPYVKYPSKRVSSSKSTFAEDGCYLSNQESLHFMNVWAHACHFTLNFLKQVFGKDGLIFNTSYLTSPPKVPQQPTRVQCIDGHLRWTIPPVYSPLPHPQRCMA